MIFVGQQLASPQQLDQPEFFCLRVESHHGSRHGALDVARCGEEERIELLESIGNLHLVYWNLLESIWIVFVLVLTTWIMLPMYDLLLFRS